MQCSYFVAKHILLTQCTNRVRDEHQSEQARQRSRQGRQTVQWPFQSVVTETEITSSSPTTTTMAPPFGRRATWEPNRVREDDVDSIAQDVVPDYVINFIRGETPETVGRRKRNGGKLGERVVDIAHQHQPHRSQMANFEGFYNEDSSHDGGSSAGRHGGPDDEQYILPGSSREKGGGCSSAGGSWRRSRIGWRAGVALNVFLSFLLLAVAIICLIVLAVYKGQALFADKSVMYTGSCAIASGIRWGLYGVASVFGVVLIAGANYVFQVLSSPTREEVTAAHEQKRWLDIGIPSVRNLGYIKRARAWLAVVILVVAVATQIV